MIDIANLAPKPGFNPRSKRDTAKYRQLCASIARRGIRQPLLVTPEPDHDGHYLIVAGEGRYLAALDEQHPQVPCLIDAVDPKTDGLDDALTENLVREDLSPLDEAYAFQRLRDGGLGVRGIAERIARTQKHVRDRLALLNLPADIQEQVDDGTIPLGAAAALLALGKIHPGLPAVGVRRVLEPPARSWDAPATWDDLASDPVSIVVGTVAEHYARLPDGVYVAGQSYPISSLPLEQKAQADLVKLGKLDGVDYAQQQVRFGREMVEQALALSAAFPSKDGYAHLIVGADVAGQLVGDQITRQLKQERARRRQERAASRNASGDDTADDGATTDADGAVPISIKQRREQQRLERKQAKEDQRQARAYNLILGIELTKQLWRVKLDDRALKVLTAAPLAVDLERIAARGARLTFPGWSTEAKRKNGSTQVEYVEPHEAARKAREYLEGASKPGEIAGRALALLAAARWADERALPQSRRSFYALDFERPVGVPWDAEAAELLDQLLIERLSPEASAPIREAQHQRDVARAARRQQEVERDHAVRALVEQAPTLTRAERENAIKRVRWEHGWTAIDSATAEAINAHLEPSTDAENTPTSDTAPSSDAPADDAATPDDGTPDHTGAKPTAA